MTGDPVPVATADNAAFDAWWPHVGPWIGDDVDPIDVAHEAFCAGWAHARAAERQRWQQAIAKHTTTLHRPAMGHNQTESIEVVLIRDLADLLGNPS